MLYIKRCVREKLTVMEKALKILVVDDDEVDRMAVRRALYQTGIKLELSEVGDCASAIAALKTNTYSCVFLDYFLPDGDGLSFINQVHSLEIKVPLVVLTGQGDEQIAVELMKAGATDYLSKSRISKEVLEQVLRNAIRVFSAEMQVVRAYQQLRESNELLKCKNQELEAQRQQIQLQNLELIEASRLKSKFLATISHELRTPMNIIIGFSQHLLGVKSEKLSEKQTDMVQRILNNGKHLLMLMNEVLDFSKLESGRLDLNPQIFDLSQVVNSTVTEMRSLAEIKKLFVTVENDLQNPVLFNDPLRLRQILTNLLSNAIKFTQSGGISISLQELPKNRVLLAVRDTGIGIQSTDIEKIFEAFRQVDEGTNRRYQGTGLGLAIIDALVQMMEGKINVESKLGEGSLFEIELPRQISSSTQKSSSLKHSLQPEDFHALPENTIQRVQGV